MAAPKLRHGVASEQAGLSAPYEATNVRWFIAAATMGATSSRTHADDSKRLCDGMTILPWILGNAWIVLRGDRRGKRTRKSSQPGIAIAPAEASAAIAPSS